MDIYEEQSAFYEAHRKPRHLEAAIALGQRRPAGPVVDLGSGPGWYTAALGRPVVALDAAAAMLRRTREVAPGCLPVLGDLAALPFRRGSLRAAWARNSYVHLRATELPMALNDLHHALAVDAPAEVTFFGGTRQGRDVFADDDLPGRWFSTWTPVRLQDVMHGAGFELDGLATRPETDGGAGYTVRATRAPGLPDFVGAGMRLLVCGLNPSLHAAEHGVGYVSANNRFWPAALAAGLVSRDRDPRHALGHHYIGMTDLVKRATARADALHPSDYVAGVARVDRLCDWLQPEAVCIVGLAGWRAAVDRRAQTGWQSHSLGGRPVYVMPSTSGLNARTSLTEFTEHLRRAVSA